MDDKIYFVYAHDRHGGNKIFVANINFVSGNVDFVDSDISAKRYNLADVEKIKSHLEYNNYDNPQIRISGKSWRANLAASA